MKTNHLLSVSLLLVLNLAVCSETGCRKKQTPEGTPPVASNTTESPSAEAQAEQTAPPAAGVNPAADQNTIAEGQAFPALEFNSLSGQQVNLANLKGKVVMIDFWATWCGPCQRVMPDLVETYKAFHDKGFEIIGISLDKDQSQLEKYMQETGITWQQYYDGLWWDSKVAKRFGVRAIPHIVLVDKKGTVYFNTEYDQKPPLHGVELRNVVAQLCGAP